MSNARFTLLAISGAVALFTWSGAGRLFDSDFVKGPIGFLAVLVAAVIVVGALWKRVGASAERRFLERGSRLDGALSRGQLDVLALRPTKVFRIESPHDEAWLLQVGNREWLRIWRGTLINADVAPTARFDLLRAAEDVVWARADGEPMHLEPLEVPPDYLENAELFAYGEPLLFEAPAELEREHLIAGAVTSAFLIDA